MPQKPYAFEYVWCQKSTLYKKFWTFWRYIFFFACRNISTGCLKIWRNGVSEAVYGSHFPGYQSVTHYCTWVVSCTGWHINIGSWCKEDNESGYTEKKKSIFLLLCFCFSLMQFAEKDVLSVTACVLCV